MLEAGREAPTFGGPGAWFTYRGGLGMLMWALHRLSGIGILLFLSLHVVDIQVTKAIGQVKRAIVEGEG